MLPLIASSISLLYRIRWFNSLFAISAMAFLFVCGSNSVATAQRLDPVVWTIQVSWTAVGDDGMTGKATAYDIRYSLDSITESNWSSALQATGEPAPRHAYARDTFLISGLLPDTPYYVAVRVRDEAFNWSGLSNVINHRSTIWLGADVGGGTDPIRPVATNLSPAYPNPFNPTTSIDFTLPRSMRVRMEIVNVMGQKVKTLLSGTVLAGGVHTVTWNGRSDADVPSASGVYFCRLEAEDRTLVNRMTLLK